MYAGADGGVYAGAGVYAGSCVAGGAVFGTTVTIDEDLPGELGHFDLVTMRRSFHWMDREQVLTALDGMVDNDGGLVIANDSCLIRSATTWQQAIEDIQQRFLPPDWQTGIPTSADGHEPHEEILARSAFRHVQQRA